MGSSYLSGIVYRHVIYTERKWKRYTYTLGQKITLMLFLTHLSTKYSEWAELLWSLTVNPSARRPLTFPCLHSSIYKYQPICIKLDKNIYDHKISDEFDYGSNRTRWTGVICPWIKKIAIFHFVYALVSTNINQSAPKLVKVYMTVRSRLSLIMGQIGQERLELFALDLKKFLYFTLFTL